tara:strand:- start:205 stop:594 length:390 start_codon:yes stop_codon:yes gene_type:complete
MSEKFPVEIITPEKTVLQLEASEVTIPSFEGEMGILKDHIPLITFLRPGFIFIKSDENKKYYIEEGTVEFSNNNLLILTSSVKDVGEIDKQSIKNLLDEAEKKIKENDLSDKEKYIISYKIDALKNISL